MFRFNCTEEHLDENNFRHCYGNFFENAVLECTWSQLCSTFWNVLYHSYVRRSAWYLITATFKVLKGTWSQLCTTFFLNNYEAHWQRHLRDNSRLKILWKWINKMLILSEQKLTKVAGKLSVAQKSKLQRTLHQNRR